MKKFKDETKVAGILQDAGYGMSDIYKMVLKTPAELKKDIGSEAFNRLLREEEHK